MTEPNTYPNVETWTRLPYVCLRGRHNGTRFLLRTKGGVIAEYELYGNMQSDKSWKARRLHDSKIVRLEAMRDVTFCECERQLHLKQWQQ